MDESTYLDVTISSLEYLIQNSSDGRVSVIGASWGANMATLLSMRGNIDIERLVLLNPGPFRIKGEQPCATSVESIQPRSTFESDCFVFEPDFKLKVQRQSQSLKWQLYLFHLFTKRINSADAQPPRVYSKSVRVQLIALLHSRSQFFAMKYLPPNTNANLPVLLIYGENDHYTNDDRIGYDKIFQSVISVRIRQYPHEIPFDKCLVAQPVAEFLKQNHRTRNPIVCRDELSPIDTSNKRFVNRVRLTEENP
jgi:pimeloyl-ACP methyl ester carboxylesterase